MLLSNWNWGTLEVCGEEGKVEGGGGEEGDTESVEKLRKILSHGLT